MKISQLRSKYPKFVYQSFDIEYKKDNLTFIANFSIEPKLKLQSKVTIHNVKNSAYKKLNSTELMNYAFHLGLAEIPSYWKATASPTIEIAAAKISPTQLEWLHDVIIKGMGEYFYTNQIEDFSKPKFLSITNKPKSGSPDYSKPSKATPEAMRENLNESIKSHYWQGEKEARVPKFLIPVGGGKDSEVSLRLLSEYQKFNKIELGTLVLAPSSPAATKLAEFRDVEHITAERVIDPKLIDLNAEGYLNGHTPFSAYLSFLSTTAAYIFGYDAVALSNERSANEGNLEFAGKTINHQWSKSFEYEQLFQDYAAKYLPSPAYYFSLLRPLYEIQIAKLFANNISHDKKENIENISMHTFRSCNRGQKEGVWCLDCPKCLFAFLILSPFISPEKLTDAFGQNLLENENLQDDLQGLLNKGQNKPLECVGMYEESLLACYLTIQNFYQQHPLPKLLQYAQDHVLRNERSLADRADKLLNGWNEDHALPARLTRFMKDLMTRGYA